MKLLNNLSIPAVSGYEDDIAAVIKSQLDNTGITYFSDAHKSIVAHIPGEGEPVMFVCAMDTTGLFITYIEENGFLRFSVAGKIDEKQLSGRKVMFKNGVFGIIGGGEKVSDMFIDIGAKNREEASTTVSISDPVALDPSLTQISNSTFAGYRAGKTAIIYAMLEGAKKLKEANRCAYFVFAAKTAHTPSMGFLNMISEKPALAYIIDTCAALDTPADDITPTRLGSGTALKIMDGSIISDAAAIEHIEKIKSSTPLFYRVVTDTAGILPKFQTEAEETDTATLSLPVRYMGLQNEVFSVSDLSSLVTLISRI